MIDWLSGRKGSEAMGHYSPAMPKRSKKEFEEDEEEYERVSEWREGSGYEYERVSGEGEAGKWVGVF